MLLASLPLLLLLLLLLLLVEGCSLLVGGKDVSLKFRFLPFTFLREGCWSVRMSSSGNVANALVEFSGYLLKLTVA